MAAWFESSDGPFEVAWKGDSKNCKMELQHTRDSKRGTYARTALKHPRNGRRNERKRRVLGALEGRGWITAAMAGVSRRAVYEPLNRYRRWGLLLRREQGGLWLYALSERG